MKKIAIGDLGEFWYGDYKEPFEQLEGGVPGQPIGALLKDDEGNLLCAFCGKTFGNLGLHSNRTHGLTAAAYKAEVGLLQKTALVSEHMRRAQVATGLRALRSHGKPYPKGHRPYTLGRASPMKGRRHAPERANKTGRCYAQLLAVAQSIVVEHGRLSQSLLGRRGIFQNTVYRYFESYEDLAKAAGARGYRTGWTRDELLAVLRQLAQKIGRTPSNSDLRRFGLPSKQPFARVFGSYVQACVAAGLDPNLPPVLDGEREAAILVAYATTGSTQKTARAVHADYKTVRSTLARYGVPVLPGGRDRAAERGAVRAYAAEMARRLTGWSDEAAS